MIKDKTVKGPWSEHEDNLLKALVNRLGPKKWSNIANYVPGRKGKQCRERWLNHLDPAEEVGVDGGRVEHIDRSSESTRKQLVTNCKNDSRSLRECGEESMEFIDASTLV